jgi:hypothetical protein
MRCYAYFVVFLAIAIHYSLGSWEEVANEKRLCRKKRYLTFPEGSTFVVSGYGTRNCKKCVNACYYVARSNSCIVNFVLNALPHI